MENKKKGIDYGDVERFGLLGILPKKKRYGTEKDKRIAREKIKENNEFIQYAIAISGAHYINDIMDKLVDWVVFCNETYYFYTNI